MYLNSNNSNNNSSSNFFSESSRFHTFSGKDKFRTTCNGCKLSNADCDPQTQIDNNCEYLELDSLEAESSYYMDFNGDVYWNDLSDSRYCDTLFDYVPDVDCDEYENEFNEDFEFMIMPIQEEEFYKYKYYAMKYLYPKNQNDVKGDIENE
jgi:hypothetical protein